MINPEEIISVPVIVSIVYGAIILYKHVINGNKKLTKIIPVIATLLGVALGITAFYTVPGVMPAGNILTAILFGGASGLASTGTDQLLKQLKTKLPCQEETDVKDEKIDDVKLEQIIEKINSEKNEENKKIENSGENTKENSGKNDAN